MSSRKLTRSIIVGAAAIAVAGGSYGIVSATSSSSPAAASSGSSTSSSGFAHAPGSGGGSNARSGPAAGGAAGTVSSPSASGFTLTTSAGQKVTIKEASSTTYQKGTSAASVSAITTGEPVLVLGTTDGTTITATQVTVEPAGNAYTATSAQVIPFQQGAPTTSKQAGQIPADYTEGSGTIVSGTAANKATEAALAAYPGGLVDRVVKLGNGEYEVHYIGVNWPHHVFVSQDFKVVGAG
jgi:membrane-bound inhibitor of C-type lysozyme